MITLSTHKSAAIGLTNWMSLGPVNNLIVTLVGHRPQLDDSAGLLRYPSLFTLGPAL